MKYLKHLNSNYVDRRINSYFLSIFLFEAEVKIIMKLWCYMKRGHVCEELIGFFKTAKYD